MPISNEVRQLLRLAERDYRVFLVLKDAEGIDLASACFHAQQSVEKFLKAVLAWRGSVFRRTHDLLELAGLIEDAGLALPVENDELGALNPYGVMVRYDDTVPDTVTRERAALMLTAIADWANALLSEERNSR